MFEFVYEIFQNIYSNEQKKSQQFILNGGLAMDVNFGTGQALDRQVKEGSYSTLKAVADELKDTKCSLEG